MAALKCVPHPELPLSLPSETSGTPIYFFEKVVTGGRTIRNTAEDALGETTPSLLIREAFQNTLDNPFTATGTTPGAKPHSTIRITLKELPYEDLAGLALAEAVGHFDHLNEETTHPTTHNVSPNRNVRVLTIEDDGTGLEGSYLLREGEIPKDGAQKYLYETGSNRSRGAKRGKAGGRWGVGTEAFALASRIRTFYSHTTRIDGSSFATGRTTISQHSYGGVRYHGPGTFGLREGDGIVPAIGASADNLHRCLGFKRPLREHGLSAAIVDPLPTLTIPTLTVAVLATHFGQLFREILTVILKDESTDLEVVLSGSEMIKMLDRDDFKTQILEQAARDIDENNLDDAFKIIDNMWDILDLIYLADRSAEVFHGHAESDQVIFTSDTQQRMRDYWNSHGSIGYEAKTTQKWRDKDVGIVPKTGYFRVFLKAPKTACGLNIRMRDNNTTIASVQSDDGYLSLTTTSDDTNAFANCIGDCEDASHLTLTAKNGTENGWVGALNSIRLFENSARHLKALLRERDPDEIDTTSLACFLPDIMDDLDDGNVTAAGPGISEKAHQSLGGEVQQESGEVEHPTSDSTENSIQGAEHIVDGHGANNIRISSCESGSGVVICLSEGALEEDERTSFTINLGYATKPGTTADKNKKERPFYGSSIRVAHHEDCDVGFSKDKSRIECRNVGPGFKLIIGGFDDSRDPEITIDDSEEAF
jgi:hypothetical protein